MTTEDLLRPTARLRFVLREVRHEITPTMATVRVERVLQQWCEWEVGVGMWRDVPLEEEV